MFNVQWIKEGHLYRERQKKAAEIELVPHNKISLLRNSTAGIFVQLKNPRLT